MSFDKTDASQVYNSLKLSRLPVLVRRYDWKLLNSFEMDLEVRLFCQMLRFSFSVM